MANVCGRNYSDTTFYKNQSIIGIKHNEITYPTCHIDKPYKLIVLIIFPTDHLRDFMHS